MSKEVWVRSFDETELFVEESGSGAPVVLCDGIGCDGFIWRHLRPALEPAYRVIHPHYRGHGRSKPPVDPQAVDIPSLRRDLLAVLDAAQVGRAVLLGHSMGVQVILDFALNHPDRVQALVPVCGSYGHPLDTFHDGRLLATVFPFARDIAKRWPGGAQWLWQKLVGSEPAYLYATMMEVDGSVVKREEFKPYFDHLSTMDVTVFSSMLDAVGHHTVEDRLQEIEAPALIIAGERDKFTPMWLSRRMQRLMPHAELLLIPRGTHVAPIEAPELIELRLQRFLADHVPGATPKAEPAEPKPTPTNEPRTRRKGNGRARRRGEALKN